MKLPNDCNTLEVFGTVNEINCEIGDHNLIMDYLRNMVYKNIKKVIVQEISSNARDANRENNNSHIPISIKTPTVFNPFWECSDSGAGMPPEIIKEVFRMFGNSTKRSDNLSIGGLGIGSKAPWGYTSSYVVKSIAWEGSPAVKMYREYHAVIGDNKKCSLLEFEDSSYETDAETGCTVVIPILPKDFYDFSEYTKQITKFWTVPPIINGEPYKPDLPECLYEHDGFCISKNALVGGNCVLLGEIQYPLDLNSSKYNNILTNKFNGRILLKFNVGDLEVAISRESLRYGDETNEKIKKRLDEALEVVQADAIKEVESAPTLWDAYRLHGVHNSILGNKVITWGIYKVSCTSIDFGKGVQGRYYHRGLNKSNPIYSWNSIAPSESSMVVINDVKTAHVKRLKTLFKNNINLDTIYALTDIADDNLLWKELTKDAVRLSTIDYERAKYQCKVYEVGSKQVYSGCYTNTNFDLEGVLVDETSADEYDVYIPYDQLYKVQRDLIFDVCDRVKLIAVPNKALKHFSDLQTFDDYVKEQSNKVSDKLISLRTLKKLLGNMSSYPKVSDTPLEILHEIFFLAKKDETAIADIDKPLYNNSVTTEREQPAKDFAVKLKSVIESSFPLIKFINVNGLDYSARNQLTDYIQHINKQTPTKCNDLQDTLKELLK